MSEYWQDKRITHRHVTCAWGLVVVAIGLMLAITSLTAPDCQERSDSTQAACADDLVVQEANAQRP